MGDIKYCQNRTCGHAHADSYTAASDDKNETKKVPVKHPCKRCDCMVFRR